MTRKVEMVGNTYGRLLVIGEASPSHHKKPKRMVMCDCLCGETKGVKLIAQDIRRGDLRSCGCLSGEISRDKIKYPSLYSSWHNMLKRAERRYLSGDMCRVFEGWIVYENFENWALNNCWKVGMELCRNGDVGDYSPENSRWDTKENNRKEAHAQWWRITTPLGHIVETFSLRQYCIDKRVSHGSLYSAAKSGATTRAGYRVQNLSNLC